jgi:SAM-dependent methyltransferase
MLEDVALKVACPKCGSPLGNVADSRTCSACGATYPLRDGVIDLAPDQSYVYSVKSLSPERFRQLVVEARRDGFTGAYRNYLLERSGKAPGKSRRRRRVRKFLRDLMLSLNGRTIPANVRTVFYESPASLWLVTGLKPDGCVLDLGAGWSAIAHLVARECGQLVAADPTLERLQLSSLRAQQEGRDNMTFVRIPTSTKLPFASGSFDLVMLNGVLEWIPESVRDGDASDVQVQILSEVRRILRPGGQVMVAIENRFALADLMGFPEGHMGLSWVGVLPRRIGDLYHRAVKKRPMRVTTYSRRGLEKAFSKAGFSSEHTAVFVPQPTYAWFDMIGSGNRRAASVVGKTTLADHPVFRRLSRSPVRHLLGPFSRAVSAFAAVGSEQPWKSVLEDLTDILRSQTGIAIGLPLERVNVRESKVMLDALVVGTNERVHVSLGMSPAGNARVSNEAFALHSLARERVVIEGALRVPRVIWEGDFRGHAVMISSHLSGNRLRANDTPSDGWTASSRIVSLLGGLTSESDVSVGELWTQRWTSARSLCHTDELRAMADDVAQRLAPADPARWARGGHGDLHPANIMVFGDGAVGAIDWECFGPQDPSEDAVACALGHLRSRYGGIGETMVAVVADPSAHADVLSQLCPQVGDARSLLNAVAMVWLKRIGNSAGTSVLKDPDWLDRRVFSVLRSLAAAARRL